MYLFSVSEGCRRMEETALPTVERVVVDHLLLPSSKIRAVWDFKSKPRKPTWRHLSDHVSISRIGGCSQAR